jgi:hypothetical protein
MSQFPQAEAAIDPHKRPIAITIICIIGFIGAAFTVPVFFMDVMRSLPPWYPWLLGVSAVIGLACLIGLWMMRKWAVYIYTAFAAINQVILIATGLWNPFALILPAIVIAVMFGYLSRMR